MKQDSETNIIVLNTALKYKIQRNTQKHKYIKYTKYKHILKRASAEAREINSTWRTFESLYRGKVSNITWQTIPNVNHTLWKKHRPGCIAATTLK